MDVKQTVCALAEVFREKNIDFIAASITYYAFFSLVPLLLLSFIILSVYGGEALATQILLVVGDLLTPTGEEIIRDVLVQGTGQRSATIFSLALFFWSGLHLFRGFDIAFTTLYDTDHDESLTEELLDALSALTIMSIAILITLTAGAVVTAFSGIKLVGIIWTIAQFLGLSLIFVPLYHVFSDIDFHWKELVPGAVLAAAGWTILQHLFRVYTAHTTSSVYSVFGGIFLLFLWLYFGNILLLLGAELNLLYREDRLN